MTTIQEIKEESLKEIASLIKDWIINVRRGKNMASEARDKVGDVIENVYKLGEENGNKQGQVEKSREIMNLITDTRVSGFIKSGYDAHLEFSPLLFGSIAKRVASGIRGMIKDKAKDK